MLTRILAAVVGLGLVIPLVIYGGVMGVDLFIGLVLLICLDEYARMAFPDDHATATGFLAAISALVWAGPLYLAPDHPLVFVGIATVATFTWVVFRIGENLKGGADVVGRYALGLLWIPGLLIYIPLLRRLEDGVLWVFLIMIIPWSSDTGGYFAGRAFGKTKLAPIISPKKTVEGLAGGLLLAVVGVFVYRATVFPALTVADCLFMGLALGAVGVVGDLAESLVKRAFEVKDSGWIIPGHGGLLDRIDALIFVAPLLYGYAIWMKG